jgi:ribosome modulation factor
MRSCWEEGYEAYYDGIPKKKNPYNGASWIYHRKNWEEGWRAAMTKDRYQ